MATLPSLPPDEPTAPSPLGWIVEELDDLQERNLYRERKPVRATGGVEVRWRGRSFISFASNDYLHLAGDPRLARAASRAARTHGCGAGASPLVSGYSRPLQALEQTLARWEGTEAALVFSSGFAANLAVLGAVSGAEDAIFSDLLNHASLIDGCRLSRAAVHVYRHLDLDHLEARLIREGGKARRRIIVTDTVFSMDGEIAPMRGLAELADRHDCLLYLDEAHATGVIGAHGRGAIDLLPPGLPAAPERIIKVGTLSKALGSQGGFVCGSHGLIDFMVNRARPYIYSTALAPPTAAAARRAVRIVAQEPERRQRLLTAAKGLRSRLQALGFEVLGSDCQIIPVVIGTSESVLNRSRTLEELGLLVPAIRPPTVPDGTARLRISLTAGHAEEHVERLVEGLRDIGGRPE